MTREEAIEVLQQDIPCEYDTDLIEALEMAIQALEQEPKYCDRNICLRTEYNGIGCDECEVTKSQDPTDENLHREREQAYMQGYEDACKKYRQEPKTGYWIFYGRLLKCSNCGYINDDILDECPNCGANMIER